jgi:lysyl endopeptidase
MKIAHDNAAPGLADLNTGGGNTHWRADFDIGTVQPGSSGSPLLDANHRVIGQLTAGFTRTDFCASRTGLYGRLAARPKPDSVTG